MIAKAGKPVVKVVRMDAPVAERMQRLGFLRGAFTVPDDFDRMGEDEIDALFGSAL